MNKKCKNDKNNQTIKGNNFNNSDDFNLDSEPEKFKKQNVPLKCKRNFVTEPISHRKRKDKRLD